MARKYTPDTHKYVAVDFDGTIIEEGDYPYIRNFLPHAIETLQMMVEEGYEVAIWTCRGGRGNVTAGLPHLTEEQRVKVALFEQGLDIKNIEVNKHFPKYYEKYKGNSPKIYADVYIDNSAYGLDKVDWLEIREAFIGGQYGKDI